MSLFDTLGDKLVALRKEAQPKLTEIEEKVLKFCTKPRTSSQVIQLFPARGYNPLACLEKLKRAGLIELAANKYVTTVKVREFEPVMSMSAKSKKSDVSVGDIVEHVSSGAEGEVIGEDVSGYLEVKWDDGSVTEIPHHDVMRQAERKTGLMLDDRVKCVDTGEKGWVVSEDPEKAIYDVEWDDGTITTVEPYEVEKIARKTVIGELVKEAISEYKQETRDKRWDYDALFNIAAGKIVEKLGMTNFEPRELSIILAEHTDKMGVEKKDIEVDVTRVAEDYFKKWEGKEITLREIHKELHETYEEGTTVEEVVDVLFDMIDAYVRSETLEEPKEGSMKKAERPITSDEVEYFNYLNDLRESGVTNMWGAASYLVDDFDLDKRHAGEVLGLWMKNFNEEGYSKDTVIQESKEGSKIREAQDTPPLSVEDFVSSAEFLAYLDDLGVEKIAGLMDEYGFQLYGWYPSNWKREWGLYPGILAKALIASTNNESYTDFMNQYYGGLVLSPEASKLFEEDAMRSLSRLVIEQKDPSILDMGGPQLLSTIKYRPDFVTKVLLAVPKDQLDEFLVGLGPEDSDRITKLIEG